MPRKFVSLDDEVDFEDPIELRHDRPLSVKKELKSATSENKKLLISPRRSGHHPQKTHKQTRSSSEIRHKHQKALHQSKHEARQRREQQIDDVVHHLVGLRKKDNCSKKIDRHSFKFVKCGVQHYNKTYDEEDDFVPIPVKPDPDSEGYALFDDIMNEYLRAIVKRRSVF